MDDGEPALTVLGRVQLHGRALRSPAAAQVLQWAALNIGRGVELDRCARTVWPELSATAGRRRAVDAARTLAREHPDSVRTSGGTLELVVDRDRIDEYAFRILVAAPDDQDAAAQHRRLGAALQLWRGTPYPGLAHLPVVARRVARLHDLRLEALERRFSLALGDRADVSVVAELRATVCVHPHREPLRRLLVAALYLSSRQVEALAELESCRRALRDRGDSPSAALDLLQKAVLDGDGTTVLAAV